MEDRDLVFVVTSVLEFIIGGVFGAIVGFIIGVRRGHAQAAKGLK